MGRWFQEEVAGDRYIFDSEKNPVVLGCPQGAPVFVIIGEEERSAQRACDAHNAMVSERDRYRHRAMEAEHCVSGLTADRDELQRRLVEIAKHAAAPNWGDIVCAGGKLELATTRLDEIRAIAEGRTE